jgi:Asp-tRNA(Asn)/Glu-tRNA(Gln) amidotransferase B subunit
MHPVGFEPTISAGERPQTYALDRAAIGTGNPSFCNCKINNTGKSMHNVTLRCICETNVPVEVLNTECVFVALGSQHAMHSAIAPSMACPALQYFPSLSDKWENFQKENS